MGFSLNEYNERQKEVITHGKGPLLVISGAGTGKTHVLTGRILYLILEKGIAPENILALTFTEKAAEEMKQRVESFLSLGTGEVALSTFHAFCDRILRERGHEIGITPDYKLLTGADLWMFLKHHVTKFTFEYFRSLSNPRRLLMGFAQYFSRLRDEDILPDAYVKHAQQMAKSAEDDVAKETAQKHVELAQAYLTYNRLLLENGYLDFGGLLSSALNLLKKRASVLDEYQKQFQYILVDEFQDTNFAQNRLVMMLSQKHKNIMVVGDDDQSIYKWRGASLTNIQYFRKIFPKAEKVVLNKNYRSSQAILNLAYSVIQKNNPNRLEINESVDKRLIAAAPHKSQPPEVQHFETYEQEVQTILAKASTLVKKGNNTAILVRTNAMARLFLDAIQRLPQWNVPYQHFAPDTLFNKPAVKDCLAVMRVITNPWDDVALFRCLKLPFWNIPMESLLELMRKSRMQSASLFDLMDDQFKEAKTLFKALIEYARDRRVSEILGKFFNDSGYLEKLKEEQTSDMEDIAAFSEKVREFEETHAHHGVSDFLEYAELLEETGDSVNAGMFLDPEALKILTIHSAKGLEFDAVFVPGLVQGKFPTFTRKDPFEVPEELIPEPLPEGNHHLEEERRLFYVSCTRAREFLSLSYSDFYDGKKQWKPSVFIQESLESGKAHMVSSKLRGGKKKSQASLPFEEGRAHRPVALTLPKLSYSQMDTFRTCPLKYQFRYLFSIPAPTPAVLNFGSSIHNTLRDFYGEIKKNPGLPQRDFWPLLKQQYEKNWIPFGYESREIQQEQKKYGAQVLEKYLKREREHWIVPEFLEKSFTLRVGDTTITGRIDRIDKLPDGTYEVIDYKTGSVKEKNLNKDLQLSIYALACKNVLHIPVSRLSLYYLESLEKVSTTRNEAQLKECEEEIQKCAAEMTTSDFSPTPGYHCSYCDFRLICPAAAPVVR